MFGTIDYRDVFYAVFGLALLGLTLQPTLSRYRIVNMPLLYVMIGTAIGLIGLPVIDPRVGGLSTAIIEHTSELIVIISLAGAGLAIDTKGSWRNWNATFRLLIVAMPLTILAIALLGIYTLGLPIAAALLLAASLAPTDPVLARSVQVSPPGQEEDPMEVSLTAEAGLNDGLAFPFVYLAITTATLGWYSIDEWGLEWLGFDFVYRVAAGWIVGYLCGIAMSRIVFSGMGDANSGGWNAIVMVLASTLISYGVTEGVDGYGFLAVFACARAGRDRSRGTDMENYEKFVHHGADQLESILLALLLLWLGTFVGSGALAGLRWIEVAFALGLIFLLRPTTGFLSLLGLKCENMARRNVAFFGVRGMGSIFYIAYAQNHADFTDIDTVWRIAVLVIVLSILIHGYAANLVLNKAEEEEEHPYREEEKA
ncbi:cation:proton antiporter [Aestuariibius insulae]|uniref:cation:proton antiporter domain-containing protein n=1 Tax=Aestuariibius insulae TaxID=2058287 RepID=UPI00345E5AB6